MKEKIIENAPFERLQRILEKTSLPEVKLGDMKWVARNFDVLEPNHPQRDEVHSLLRVVLFLDKTTHRKISNNVDI